MRKATGKISTTIVLLGILCGIATVSLAVFGFPELLNTLRFGVVADMRDWSMLVSLGGMLLGFLFSVWALIRIVRQVVHPVRDAAMFADLLANGEFPVRLSEKGMRNSEIQTLFTALNLLRDRQQNLNSKLQLSLSHEAELRRGAESHSLLLLRIIARMLPEMRIPLGSIKGFSRVLMLDLENESVDRAEMLHLLEEIGHRVGTLSRQIERLHDISELNRDRWSRSEALEFDTAEFMREAASANLISLQEREIMLVNRFSASAPERLFLDRELLLQLLTIMTRAIGRAAAPGETLVLSCYREDGKVIFEVCDSMHAPLREPVVETFRKFENSVDPQGFAAESQSVPILGLIFARDLAEKLGGSLHVAPSEASAAVIRCELFDGCIAQGAEFRQLRGNVARVEFPKNGTHSDDAKKREQPIRVLHGSEVADSPYLLKRLLGAEHIDVYSVDCVEKLRKEASAGEFDALILSPSLKGCELSELIAELRQITGRRELPVVVVGDVLSSDLRRDLKALNRVFLLNIPVNYALLSRIIHETAGGHA